MNRRLPILGILTVAVLLGGCSNQFRFKDEYRLRSSAWPFPRGTVEGLGAVSNDSAEFNGQLEPIWTMTHNDKPAGPLTISHGLLVYPSSRKRLRFIDLANGHDLGMTRIKGVPQTGAVVRNSVAYLGVMPPQDKMIALDLKRKKIVWSFPIKDPTAGSIIVKDRLIFSSVAGQITALAIADGKKEWQMDADGRLLGPVSARDSLIVVPTDRGELLALSAVDGRQIWRTKLDGPGVAAVAIGELIFTTDVRGHVLAVSPESGSIVWRADAGGPIWGSPAVADGRVVVGHSGGEIVAFDSRTGEKVWSFATVEVVRSSPVIAGNFVVAGTMGGTLFSLRLGDGTLVARQHMVGAIEQGPVSDGRRIYAATQSGRIVCYGEHNGPLPQGRH